MADLRALPLRLVVLPRARALRLAAFTARFLDFFRAFGFGRAAAAFLAGLAAGLGLGAAD
ncbi:MAG TPA: hypothetical protein VHM01_05590 [Alphaproteobacteria bacterium]|nr:hypothetical protein [Alphaproteobacteria bacterium]